MRRSLMALPALLVPFSLVAQDAPKPAQAPAQNVTPAPAPLPAPGPASGQAPSTPTPGAQRITLQEAIATALRNNLQVSVAQESRRSTVSGVQQAEGAFDWTLNGQADYSRKRSPNEALGLDQRTTTKDLLAGVTKPFVWGGVLKMNYGGGINPSYPISASNADIQSASGTWSTYYPTSYAGTFSAAYTQPLLRGFGRDVAESTLIIARKGAQAADYEFQRAIIDLVSSTESLYWDVVFAQRNLENKKVSLSLAQKQLRENRIRVDVGTLAPIEVVNAEASVAQREQDIIQADVQYRNAVDAMIQALYPEGTRPAALEMADAPVVAPIKVDEPTAERMAMERRVELKSAQLDVESRQVAERAAASRTKPQLDLTVGYSSTSYGTDSLSNVNKDILQKGTYPNYTVGLTFAYPILNRAARGARVQAKAQTRLSELNKRQQELNIQLEVRQAFRNVEANAQAVTAASKTREYRERNLEAEQKKFENGMSTNFFVLQRQDELDQAKAAELQTQVSYAKALTALEKAMGNLLEARKLEVR